MDESIIEKELGFSKGYFSYGGGLVRIDADDVTGLNLRLVLCQYIGHKK